MDVGPISAGPKSLGTSVDGRRSGLKIKVSAVRFCPGPPSHPIRNSQLRRAAHLYRVFAFRKAPRLYAVPGAFSARFDLSPTQFLAKIASEKSPGLMSDRG